MYYLPPVDRHKMLRTFVFTARINKRLLLAFSRFYLEIKQRHRKAVPTQFILSFLLGKKKISILLADDDPDDREIFTKAINDISPDVVIDTAENGVRLMEMLNENERALPDLIFLDLNMPIKNGYECLEEIRANSKLRKIPVIIYSTSSSTEHIDYTYNKGANFYLCKPDSFSTLKTLAGKLLALNWDEYQRPDRNAFVLKVK